MKFTKSVDGQRLAELRGKRSREWIAHELRSRGHATDAKAIWRWENGRNQPNARVLPDYAEVLGADSVDELYGDAEDEEAALSLLSADDYRIYGELTARILRASQPQAERASERQSA